MSAFADLLQNLDKFVVKGELNAKIIELLQMPEKVITVRLTIRLDNNEYKTFTGYRSLHSTILGPGKGGIRFHQDINLATINGLACLMTLKNSLAGLPYGGAKGGVDADVTKLSVYELERLARAYIRAIAHDIGANVDIPASDIGVKDNVIGWMLDEYEHVKRCNEPAVITSKPVVLGGIDFRLQSTGYGVSVITNAIVNVLKYNPKAIKIAIQGFGNVGAYTYSLLYQAGYKIVGVSDVANGIYAEDGFASDIGEKFLNYVKLHPKANVSDEEFLQLNNLKNKVKFISNDELLSLDVDILLLCAIDNVITSQNMHKIQARCIIEGANSPLSIEADNYLYSQGALVVPDILVNAGGVIGSYFEWLQNLQGIVLSSEILQQRLKQIMSNSFQKVYQLSLSKEISLRDASYLVAVKRIEEAILCRMNI